MKHEHKECEHKRLAYCKVCKVVYCEDCSREWSDYPSFVYPNTTWIYEGKSTTGYQWPVYSDENGTQARDPNQIITICNHAH